MLDRKFIVENAELIRQNCLARGATADIDTLIALEAQRRDKLSEAQEQNRLANETSKQIGGAKTAEERDALKEKGRALRELKDVAQTEHDALELQILEIQAQIPNLTHPASPIGHDDTHNTEVSFGKTPVPKFDFKPKDHLELGKSLDLIDFEAGARVAGAGFYFLRNEAVLLDLALQMYAIQQLVARGFTPVTTPDVAHTSILHGIGFMPRGPETQIYSIENTDLNLVATAEITLGGMLSGQTLEAEHLPLKLAGISHCFRTEAGAAGRASKGMYRVHQFTKIEMFAFCLPEQSDALHEELREIECHLFDAVEVPYRVVDTATGDLGGPAYRKYDLEAWMPGRGENGEWGEVTSTSNCTDYQARRLNIRYKNKGEKGTHFTHTLNGTAFAISRAMIAIVENHQQSDGTIRVPKVLQPWVGKEVIGKPPA
ncbi:serine--tRNA ligase [Aureliella helgolandensis]|uniref:Serine--tRNA ligase n=1 Tax=Aureliella helgolandensis TaxID=2527968 RepID=A0A518GES4_9BACT|nr:serine--tRNA ligase [Aureliella helgolandensis]QDV27099.1 Serine--tRNA ligase [Aureliella helgolandensis]